MIRSLIILAILAGTAGPALAAETAHYSFRVEGVRGVVVQNDITKKNGGWVNNVSNSIQNVDGGWTDHISVNTKGDLITGGSARSGNDPESEGNGNQSHDGRNDTGD